MAEPEALRAHAERIRASGVLGRSPLMQRLFDFLLECSLAGKAPKEIEVAMDAFGKGADFDVSQDAMVRVYVHKLRRKLEEFYAGPGAGEPVRIAIPKGEYRFVVESPAAAGGVSPSAPVHGDGPADPATTTALPAPDEHPPFPAAAAPSTHSPAATRPASQRLRTWLLAGALVALLVNAVLLLVPYLRPATPLGELAEVRASPIWAPLLQDDRTIFIVVGDYYIFGETDERMEVRRLVREFDINSPQDLEQFTQLNPEIGERYRNLDLAYLPTATAFALRDVMPVLAAQSRRVRVVTMSELNPAVIKSAHIVYLGYLSGLGRLRELVFAGSRLSFGSTYDEVVDLESGRRYVSQAGIPYRADTRYHDYAYFATFGGPSGNRFIIIAGTRDVATMHMSESATSPRALAALLAQAGTATDFEALYEVYGMDRFNLDGKLLMTSPLDGTRIWTSTAATSYPR